MPPAPNCRFATRHSDSSTGGTVGSAREDLPPSQLAAEMSTAACNPERHLRDSPSRTLSGARVLVTTMHYRPETAGSGPYTADVAEYLAACGARVRVVTAQPHYPQNRRPDGVANRRTATVEAGVEVVRVRGYIPRRPALIRRVVYELAYVAAGLREVVTRRPDVVIACVPSQLSGALGAWIARRRRVPCVTMVQDLIDPPVTRSTSGRSDREQAARLAIARWTFRRSMQITVPVAAFAPVVQGMALHASLAVVPSWSRIAPPESADALAPAVRHAQREAMRRKLGWQDRFVIVHTGNIGAKQGLEELAPALHYLAVAQPEALVSFVGNGVRLPELELVVAGLANVQIHQPVSIHDYPLLLQAADALLVHEASSVRDLALPRKLTSYFPAGRPVLAVVRSESSTAVEVARSGAGVVIAPHDAMALAAHVGLLRASPHLRDVMGAAGETYAERHLRPAVALDQLARLVSNVLDQVPPQRRAEHDRPPGARHARRAG